MEKEVELFDKKFVHFMWDDSLEGKEGFFADDICNLQKNVEKNVSKDIMKKSENYAPFLAATGCSFRFFYYDPNYAVKRAYYKEGKAIEYRDKSTCNLWETCPNPMWLENAEYRIKPEEKWIVYLCRRNGIEPYLASCKESEWEFAQKTYGAKTKLYVGAEVECAEWYKTRKKFAEVIEAWEDGEKIQYLSYDNTWKDCNEPEWFIDEEYRVKPKEKTWYVHQYCPTYFCDRSDVDSLFSGTKDECEDWIEEHEKECPCEEGINSKACAGCPQDEARRVDCSERKYNELHVAEEPCATCSPKHLLFEPKEACRPFKDCDELVKFWTEKYQSVARPANTMPLIWIKKKESGSVCLITGYDNGDDGWGSCVFLEDVWIFLKVLFDDFEFLDGKPCGMEKEKGE